MSGDGEAIVRQTRRVMLFSTLAAGCSLVAAMAEGPGRRGAVFHLVAGFVTAMAGFQVMNARRLYALVAPSQVRGWMVPAAALLYAVGGVVFVLGLLFLGRNGVR